MVNQKLNEALNQLREKRVEIDNLQTYIKKLTETEVCEKCGTSLAKYCLCDTDLK